MALSRLLIDKIVEILSHTSGTHADARLSTAHPNGQSLGIPSSIGVLACTFWHREDPHKKGIT